MMPGTGRRGLWIAIALIAVTGAVLMSPRSREALADVVSIAGLGFRSRSSVAPSGGAPAAGGSRILTLAEARRELAFDVPAWAPEGFRMVADHVVVTDISIPGFSTGEALIELEWRDDSQRVIRISIQRTDPSVKHDDVVAPGAAKEVSINGKPAAVVAGAWDADSGLWSRDGLTVVSWRQASDIYDLSGETLEDLLRMAESMPHFQDS